MKKYTFLLLFLSSLSYSQTDSLKPITIKVDPAISIEKELSKVPFAVSSQSFAKLLNSKQQLSLDEYLNSIPGLFVLNRSNFSQDLRVSIRGFGARSAFGIRGIKIVVDGIPETTPDGQGQIDNLTLGIIDKLQVLRGPASILYGNAAGGTINIQTIRDVDSSYILAGGTLGNYGMFKYDVIAGIDHSNGSTIISGSKTSSDGYREHSGFETNQLNIKSSFAFAEANNLSLQFNYTDSPFALDAGGLTLEEVNQDRRQARDRNIQFDSQEQVRQLKTGISYQKQWSQLGLNSYGFYSYRDFDNKLPFENGGQVELYRNYYGQGSYLTYETNNDKLNNKVQLGYALAFQADQRQRFDNLNGDRGDLSFDQLESFNSYGFYLIDNLQWNQWNFQGGLRYDINSIEVDDRTVAANNSNQNLNSWSGSAGVSYQLTQSQNLYANISTSFETPALTELSSNPDGSTGFNQDLQPQKATNYELGYKSSNERFQWNAALFYIKTKDDLVPFELSQFPDRTFFRNAGSTDRYGIELYGDLKLNKQLSLQATYTYSDFQYGEYMLDGDDLNGNMLPAIPEHLATLGLNYQAANGFVLQWNNTYRGELFADDLNNTSIEDAFISNVSMSYPLKLNNWKISINGGVNNLFDTEYFDNVRINAFGNRYYEPAPGINFYTGVKVRI